MKVVTLDSELQARVKRRMSDLGLNAYLCAKKAGLGETYVRDIIRGKTRRPSADNLAKLAAVLDTSTKYLMGDDNVAVAPFPVAGLPVVAIAQPFVWVEHSMLDGDLEMVALARDPRFPNARQYAVRIRGNGMDEVYSDDTYVTCADFKEAAIPLRHGLHVHVERYSDGGDLIEHTVRAVQQRGNRLYLVAKSSNPKLTPIEAPEEDSTKIVIKGIVTGSWKQAPI